MIGVAGQNNPNPFSIFSDHAVVNIQGISYDPSYGIKASTLEEWENTSLAGFSQPPLLREGVVDVLCRKGANLIQETSFQIINE